MNQEVKILIMIILIKRSSKTQNKIQIIHLRLNKINNKQMIKINKCLMQFNNNNKLTSNR